MKKQMLIFLFALLFVASIQIEACPATQPLYDTEFNQDKMAIQNEKIYLISSFDNKDFVTCYDFYGQRIWYAPFNEKIISWRSVNDLIFVFSKSRNGDGTTITCLDAWTGAQIWQRP